MRPTLLTLALGTSLLAGCGSHADQPSPPPRPTDELPVAATATQMIASDRCETVRDLMVDTVVHQLLAPVAYTTYPDYGRGRAGVDAKAMDRSEMPRAEARSDPAPTDKTGAMATTEAAPAGPSHYTTTNVQERNVDEADLVKTDGKHIYTLRNSELIIAKTWPVEDTKLAARVVFTKLAPQQLYLHGDQVIVQGVLPSGVTRIVVIDAHDRTQPKVTAAYDVDGQTTSSRVVGDDLYLVQSSALAVPQKLYELGQKQLAQVQRADQQSLRPWEVQSRLAKSLQIALRANLSESEISAALPQIRSDGLKTPMACGDLFVPQNNTQLGLTAIARISLGQPHTDLVGAMVDPLRGQVYASTESLYVTAPSYTWNQQGAASTGTAVHQFSLHNNEGRPTYVASGSVPGQLLNQFSMSEYNGDLRIATTDADWGGSNHLSVLRPQGRSLTTIGSLDGIAKGERIYAGRMFGEQGYLVTFRQTDPLFTLDLSDPRHPRVAGELKVNGFSSYIHPMGDGLLLTIGQDADDRGVIAGLQLQVFDVSNPAKPTRKFQEKVSSWSTYSNSTAAQDHHAFTYDPVSGTVSIPAAGTTSDGEAYNGLIVYGIDKKRGFTLYGRVSHRQLAKETLDAACDAERAALGTMTDPWGGSPRATCDAAGIASLIPVYSQIDRSIVIDNYLVSLGTAGLEIHSLEKLSIRAARMSWPLPAPASASEVTSAD